MKLLYNQVVISKSCPFTKETIRCSQSVNKNLNPPKYYGKITCLISDGCKNNNCEYHNNFNKDI